MRRDHFTNEGESSESAALRLLEELREKRIGIADLMGPISGIPGLGHPPRTTEPKTQDSFSLAAPAPFLPHDINNQRLIDLVYPSSHVNASPSSVYDLVVIGAGAAGLISSIMAHWLGKRVALVESHAMGGDCLNCGCVPSKALLACANAFHNAQNSHRFGVKIEGKISINFEFVMKRMREIRSQIAKHDSVQRYASEFCQHVFLGHAVFSGEHELCVNGENGDTRTLRFHKAMIATGASPNVPRVLSTVPHLTSNDFFNLQSLPPRLLVIGGGPVAAELAQAMCRLGGEVVCISSGERLLPREDTSAVEVLLDQLREDGIVVHTKAVILSVNYVSPDSLRCVSYSLPWGLYRLCALIDGEQRIFEAEALLNATGRLPNVEELGLHHAGVQWDPLNGVEVNSFFQTANKNIYACGDCASSLKFTHAADFQARAAVRNMFLDHSVPTEDLLIPHCVYTNPEIASVGRNEEELKNDGVEVETFVKALREVDRCLCDGDDRGFVKILVRANSSQIVGATICGPRAGDMISEITLCMQHDISVTELAGTIHPYPTAQEAVRNACLGYNKFFKNRKGAPFLALQLFMNENSDCVKTENIHPS